jgi:16S rRNA (uracil1498-N3)-methyltransferase
MYRFYVEPGQITDSEIVIFGTDVNHIRNVLRMQPGEQLVVCDGQGRDYICEIESLEQEEIRVKNLSSSLSETELPVKLVLFQGIPKKDKMELIIQKTVELGIAEIVPVAMKRCVAKLEDKKKEAKKLERWQEIARAAAKQSGRGVIPVVRHSMTYAQALEYAGTLDMLILPYENADGMKKTKEAFSKAAGRKSAGILIGPEGGFDWTEIERAKERNAEIVSLGKRILRTETAGLAALSMLMYEIECSGLGIF